MMLQMDSCWDCEGLETARVINIDALDDWVAATVPRIVHVEFGECSEIVTTLCLVLSLQPVVLSRLSMRTAWM